MQNERVKRSCIQHPQSVRKNVNPSSKGWLDELAVYRCISFYLRKHLLGDPGRFAYLPPISKFLKYVLDFYVLAREHS